MNPTFKIESLDTGAKRSKLMLVIGMDTISFLISDNEGNCIAIHSYHLPAETTAESVSSQVKIIASQELLKDRFEKVTIIYSLPAAIIIPEEFSGEDKNKEMLDLIYGDLNDALIKADTDADKHRHVIYAVPKSIDSVVSYIFSTHDSKHIYSLLPKVKGLNSTVLYCIFCNANFILMLQKDNGLQAIQTYSYKSPEDVAYYLLHVCESFEVPVDDVTVYLNGMITENSNLYNEICKYFLHIHFAVLRDDITYPPAINEYPSHYFSHLIAIAQCV